MKDRDVIRPSRCVHPVPEIVMPGRPWQVQHTPRGGHTVPSKRILVAPLDDNPFARALRLHELGHVGYSPLRFNPKSLGVSADTILAVEDARVNELVGRAGLGHVMSVLDDPASGLVDPRDDLRIATLLLVASHGTGGFERLWRTYELYGSAGHQARHLASRAVGVFRTAAAPRFRQTVLVARMLERALGAGSGHRVPFLCNGVVLAADATGRGKASRAASRGRKGKDGVPWGELRGVDAPPRLVRNGKAAFVIRAGDEGSLFRAPHRFAIDGRVFARRQRRAGGTLLIDGSGSMRLDREDLIRLLGVAPAAQVARYDGDSSAGWGKIRILARNGWRVPDDLIEQRCAGSGNVIDGPALRWLATQPAPRVWVTDGGVTGVGDDSDPALTAEAQALCGRHGIVQVSDADEARKVLAGGR